MNNLSFTPKKITRKLIKYLPDRAQDVIVKRYGLGDTPETMTLEAIGTIYGITRERVRQIENHALNKLRESGIVEEEQGVFDELRNFIHSLGGVVPEEHLLEQISPRKDVQNHIYLLLTLGDPFNREREDKKFKHRWHINKQLETSITDALDRLYKSLDKNELVSEQEVINRFVKYLDAIPEDHSYHREDEGVLRRWLALSKEVDRNPLGEWGRTSSSNVKVKGVRDFAYLVLRDHGSPMHFTEVTDKIRELFGKKAHVATTHNELIKDDRFVLVGRGLYALRDWGYATGVVRDVIKKVLEDNGPLTKEEVVEKVLKERYVKPNTVIVNLQDSDHFVKLSDGRYTNA